MKVLSVSGLSVRRASDDAPILTDIALELEAGQVMGVVGESGSGKSTLGLALLGAARPGARIAAGEVWVDGTSVLSLDEPELRRARREIIAAVAQDPATALNPSIRIGTQLREGLGRRAGSEDRAREALQSVGLPSTEAFLRRKPAQLSGGQQQRVAIAAAVAAHPRVIVLDEPTTGLDVSTQKRVLELISGMCRERGLAAVFVTHDLAVVAEIADQVTVLYGGEAVECGAATEVLTVPAHPYTRALIAALPSAQRRHRLRPLPGRSPDPAERAGGCIFVERCPIAIPVCRIEAPAAVPTAAGAARCHRADEAVPARVALPSLAPRSAELDAAAPALTVRGLTAQHGRDPVLRDIGLEVRAGECLAIVGESGSGKTTLSRCLVGLHPQHSGEIRLGEGRLAASVAERSDAERRRLQYIFQNPFGSLNPRRSVGGALGSVLSLVHGVRGQAGKSRAAEALERVELSAQLIDRYPADLSGGQRQRVAIARALLADPDVLICDEVTSALDVSVQAAIVELLRGFLGDGLSMLFVTHNLAVVRSIADSVAVLYRGRIVEAGPSEQVLDAPRHPVTAALRDDTLDLR